MADDKKKVISINKNQIKDHEQAVQNLFNYIVEFANAIKIPQSIPVLAEPSALALDPSEKELKSLQDLTPHQVCNIIAFWLANGMIPQNCSFLVPDEDRRAIALQNMTKPQF